MQSIWFKGEKDKDLRIKEIQSYRNAFDALKEVLEQNYHKKEAVLDYDSPNWAYRQIHVNAYNQVLDDVIKLITIDKD